MEDYEKKYKDALANARQEYTTTENVERKQWLEELFPELKESEDEKIRKALVRFHKSTIDIDGIKGADILAWLERQGEKKSADMVEPRFKVKYAGSEYNVLEVKDIAGVTFYGIEDEPNHIDYVKAENCETISGYAIKENGSPYPTKSAVFSEQKQRWSEEDEIEIPFGAKDSELQEVTYYIPKGFHAEIDDDKVVIKKGEKSAEWSDEDEKMYKIALSCIETLEDISNEKNMHADVKDWLKSLKDRIGG